jgi:hypothetical protein
MLPLTKYPPDFEARERLAVTKTKEFVKERFLPDSVPARRTANDHDSDDSCQESDDSWDISVEASDPARPYLAFVEALPHCVVLNLGFQAVMLFPQADKWCYCPCSKKGDNWRKRFNLPSLEKADVCSSTNKFTPQ